MLLVARTVGGTDTYGGSSLVSGASLNAVTTRLARSRVLRLHAASALRRG